MNHPLHPKSLAAGVVLGAILTLTLAAGVNRPAPPGRFQIVTADGHAFILDTATGQAWEKFVPPTSGNSSSDFMNPKID